MNDTEILHKIAKLPEPLQQEILDFIDFLTHKYMESQEHQLNDSENPMLELAGFAEIGKMDSADIDKEI